jgi:hypothetical protein
MVDIVSQLVHIYYYEEWWMKNLMPLDKAVEYHRTRYENGDIHVYEENGVVLGYYERYFKDNVCTLYNLWVEDLHRKGIVFKALKKHFFETMPKNIDTITGEKQKLGGKVVTERIKHGK